jgi:hypothetical protein
MPKKMALGIEAQTWSSSLSISLIFGLVRPNPRPNEHSPMLKSLSAARSTEDWMRHLHVQSHIVQIVHHVRHHSFLASRRALRAQHALKLADEMLDRLAEEVIQFVDVSNGESRGEEFLQIIVWLSSTIYHLSNAQGIVESFPKSLTSRQKVQD